MNAQDSDQLRDILERFQVATSTKEDLVMLRRALLAGQVALAAGDRAVAIGGDATDAVIVTGDGTVVQVFRGFDAEIVRQVVRDVLGEAPKVDLVAAEVQYREQVVKAYNRLGFEGFPEADLVLTKVPLEKVFVRLSLTVEKVVRPPEGLEGERPEGQKGTGAEIEGLEDEVRWGRRLKRMAGGDEKERRERERIKKVQEPVTLVKALSKNVLLVGEPGAGKSTLLRWLAVTFAQEHQRETDRLGADAEKDRLPVYVELGRLPDAYLRGEGGETPKWVGLLPELIAEQQAFDKAAAPVVSKALADGRCLVLCDGLDEVADRVARGRIARSLEEFGRLQAGNRVVIGSRPAGMAETESTLRSAFERCQIERFTPEEVRQFFRFWYGLDESLAPIEQVRAADVLFEKVQTNPGVAKLAATPLLATILLLIWRNEGDLPGRRVEVYERCCQILVETWERHHEVDYSGVVAALRWEDHLKLLEPLAYAIHSQEQRTSARREELTPVLAESLVREKLCSSEPHATREAEKYLAALALRSGLFQRLGPDEYGFPHLTLQEYLTARYVAEQSYPDYIDLFMVHLYEAWWREVHLLTIGHLGSDEVRGKKASRLIREILDLYPPPSRLLWPIHRTWWSLELGVVFPRLEWRRRIAWLLGRELELAASGFVETIPTAVDAVVRHLHERTGGFVRESLRDDARLETARNLLPALARVSPSVVDELIEATGSHSDFVREVAVGSLGALGTSEVSQAVAAALIRALNDPSEQVRETAEASLIALRQVSPTVLNLLIRALREGECYVRQVAVCCLGSLHTFPTSPELVGELMGALEDDDWRVREEAVSRLGAVDAMNVSQQVVELLIRTLNDGDPDVREAAVSSLVRHAHLNQKVEDALTGALSESNTKVRQSAASGLVGMGRTSLAIVNALIAALGDSDTDVREAARSSVIQFSRISSEGVDALIEALGYSDGRVREEAARSLGALDKAQWSPEVFEALTMSLEDKYVEVRLAAAHSLIQLNQLNPMVLNGLILNLSDHDRAIRKAAASGLGMAGSAHASPAVVDALLLALGDTDWDVREEAASSLGNIGAARTSPYVVKALLCALSDRAHGVRRAVMDGLGQLDQASPDVVKALIVVLGDSDREVRRVAALTLGQLGQTSPEAVDALTNVLGDSNSEVREAAAVSLGTLGAAQVSPGVVAGLTGALGDSENVVRQTAAASLGHLGQTSPDVVAALVGALGDGEDWGVRQAAASSLVLLGHTPPEVVTTLIGALADGNRGVRAAAESSLVQLGQTSSEVVTALIGALANGSRDVWDAAVSILRELNQTRPFVIAALIEATGDSDWRTRHAAVHGLTSIGTVQQSSEVVEALTRASNDRKGEVRYAALDAMGSLGVLNEAVLQKALLWLEFPSSSRIRRSAMQVLAELLDGRALPGESCKSLGERKAKLRRRMQAAIAVGVVSAILLAAVLWTLAQEWFGANSRVVVFVLAVVGLLGLMAAVAGVLQYVRGRGGGKVPG